MFLDLGKKEPIKVVCKNCGGEVNFFKEGISSGETIYICKKCNICYKCKFSCFTGEVFSFERVDLPMNK